MGAPCIECHFDTSQDPLTGLFFTSVDVCCSDIYSLQTLTCEPILMTLESKKEKKKDPSKAFLKSIP